MKTLDLDIFYGGKYDCGCETDATDIEFSNSLYNKLKKYYLEYGEVILSEVLEESNILTSKEKKELESIIENLIQECIDNDDTYYTDDEDDEDYVEEQFRSTPDEWEFRFTVIPPEDWDEE